MVLLNSLFAAGRPYGTERAVYGIVPTATRSFGLVLYTVGYLNHTSRQSFCPQHRSPMSDTTDDQAFPDEPSFKDSASSFGIFYPKNYLLGVFADEATARKAGVGALAAGFPDDGIIVASGAELVAREDEVEDDKGFFAKIGEEVSKFYTDEAAKSDTLVKLAADGAGFVLIYAPEDEQTAAAATVLREFSPSLLRKYGTLAISELRV